MISLRRLISEVLSERLTFNQLLGGTDSGRARRASHVSSKSVRVTTIDEDEAWTFSYKSQGNHSTTGKRWHGYVRFLKDNISKSQNAADVDCMVDCDCPDYKYRFAYNNAVAGAGVTGNQSWNKNNGNPPRPRSQGGVGDYGNGICKHLISIGRYLQTEMQPDQPQQPEVPVQPQQPTATAPTAKPKPSVKPSKPSASTTPSTPSTPSTPTSKPAPKAIKPTAQPEVPPQDQEDPDPEMMAAPQPTKPEPQPAPEPEVEPEVEPTQIDPRLNDDDEEEPRRGLTEMNGQNLFQLMEKFVKSHPQFDVPIYEDDQKPT